MKFSGKKSNADLKVRSYDECVGAHLEVTFGIVIGAQVEMGRQLGRG